ncbi:PAS domain S-box protein [uncultured Methylobacterium sp.]|uniref:helix-turn-helix transcriptional regulator n=1 Tax=uncultured Methylobacterium sp. TaxID=157278 RepID=UPI0035CB3FF8
MADDATDQAQLRQIVSGLSEGVILIRPDRTIAYANPAALAMHGVEALDDLGATVAAYRHNFLLAYRNHHEIGPVQHPLDRVLAGERFRDAVVEVRQARDPDRVWMHRIRNLVITDGQGRPSAALILQDVSDRYEAEARFEAMFRANPAPAVICRLSDLRYVKVNQGFLDLTGYAHADVFGRSFSEIDLLTGAEHRHLAITHLHGGRTIPQMEACLRVPKDAEKYVIVAGHPIAMPGGTRCMLFTFADLEDRRKAEVELRASEERFAKAFALSPVPTVLLSADAQGPASANEAFARTFGAPGDAAAAAALWIEATERERFRRELKRQGQVRGFEARLRTRDGGELTSLITAVEVVVDGTASVLCAVQDITERKRTETELIQAIEAVMTDASWFSRSVIEKLALLRNPPRSGAPTASVEQLTLRERDMLVRICAGETDAAIAAGLGLSQNTVRNHVTRLYRKLGVNRRSAVVVWGRERGIGAAALPPGRHAGKPAAKPPDR